MLTSKASPAESASTFDAIARAMTETERGRWFLAEYVRRQRNADLQALINALGRLQGGDHHERTSADERERMRFRLVQMQRLVERNRIEIALAPGSQPALERDGGDDSLRLLAHEQEKTTAALLDAAELIQEMAWNTSAERAEKPVTERLAGFYSTAANSMAVSERLRLLARLIDQIEQRLAKAVEACDAPAAASEPPMEAPADPDFPQSVRLVVNNAGQAPVEPVATAMHNTSNIREQLEMLVAKQAEAAGKKLRRRARTPSEILSGLNALSATEKLRRFT